MSSLKQKTIVAETAERFDELCNEFKKTKDVKFEQTHVVFSAGFGYIAVMFYEEKQ